MKQTFNQAALYGLVEKVRKGKDIATSDLARLINIELGQGRLGLAKARFKRLTRIRARDRIIVFRIGPLVR